MKCLVSCRKRFVNKKSLEILTRKPLKALKLGKISHSLEGAPSTCRDQVAIRQFFKTNVYFDSKENKKPRTRTRKKLRSFEAFRADERATISASIYLKGSNGIVVFLWDFNIKPQGPRLKN